MREVVNKLKFSAVKSLTRLVISAMENAALQIEAQPLHITNTQLPPVREESQAVAERFLVNMNQHFDGLLGKQFPIAEEEPDYDAVDQVDHDYLEAIIAMEGMVNHARNTDISEYLSFSTRLDSVFENLRIDETNNPLDPEQIGEAFNNAIKPLGLKAHYLLTIYREFNKAVFHNMESILAEANQILIDMGIMPNLDMKSRDREKVKSKRSANRPKTDPAARAFEDEESLPELTADEIAEKNAQMLSMLRQLLQGLVAQGQGHDSAQVLPVPVAVTFTDSSADASVDEKHAQQQALLDVLSEVQNRVADAAAGSAEPTDSTSASVQTNQILNDALAQAGEVGRIQHIDPQLSDVINLVSLLFEAIWKDDSLPAVMKELIARTQLPIMKIALTDTSFFGDEQHPARVILNEFAMAGIAWMEPDMVVKDPMFGKVKELVERILDSPEHSKARLQAMINELRVFKGQQSGQDVELEQRLRESGEHSQRLEDVESFVSQEINERVVKRSALDPSIRNLLDTYIHQFLVKLVLKEGPGGSSWKPVMSTIDVLLWTVQPEKQPGDKERFDKINPRLLDNLTKALKIGGASKSRITKIMRQLKLANGSLHLCRGTTPICVRWTSFPLAYGSNPKEYKEHPCAVLWRPRSTALTNSSSSIGKV